MKKETVLKVLKRYEKGLKRLKDLAADAGDSDILRYEFDRSAFEQAIKELEGRNTKS